MNFAKLEKEMFVGEGFKITCNECGQVMTLQCEDVPESYDEDAIQVSFKRNSNFFGLVCICGNTAYVSE